MTNIIAFSGRKQSGKNTVFNFLLGLELLKLGVVRKAVEVRPEGLFISDVLGNADYEGLFDIDRNNDTTRQFNEEFIYPFIRNYSFADCLKTDVCINLLGLTHDQCYGTDEQKNSITHLMWEDMPGVLPQAPPKMKQAQIPFWGRMGKYYDTYMVEGKYFIVHEPGPMTAREVMQYVGTDLFRRMYDKVWSAGTINRIKDYATKLAIITDCRFVNEVKATQEAGGKVIRFTRNGDDADAHESERALDRDRFDWNKFDAVVDNAEMTISEQNEATYKVLEGWGYVDQIGNASLTEAVS